MSRLRSIMLRRGALILAAVILSWIPRLRASDAPPGFFALLDEAPLVVTATVAERTENPSVGVVVYQLAVRQVLKGTAAADTQVVVEDLVFPSDRPTLAIGEQWLVALEPLPSSSRYRSLPGDKTYLRIRAGRHGVRSAQASAVVQRYLAAVAPGGPRSVDTVPGGRRSVGAEPGGRRSVGAVYIETRHSERIGALIAAVPNPLVGGDAVAALAADQRLARDLSEAQSRELASALGNKTLPLERRRALLELIQAKRLAALLPAVRPLLADPTLAPFARRVLAAFGERPDAKALRADVEQLDPAARRAALESARSLPADERLALLAGIAQDARDDEVRCAAIDALARDGRAALPVLATLLHDPNRRVSSKAAIALAAAGGDDALGALSSAFAGGSYDAQVAAVFALRDIGSPDALRILRDVRAAPPDPKLQKVIDLALGINTHSH